MPNCQLGIRPILGCETPERRNIITQSWHCTPSVFGLSLLVIRLEESKLLESSIKANAI